MSPYDTRPVADGAGTSKAASFFQFDLADMVGIVRRGWLCIFIGTLIGVSAAAAVLSFMPPLYKAESRILFERAVGKHMKNNISTDGPSVDECRDRV